MAFGVVTHHLSFGSLAGVINEVTGDGSTQTWSTGLGRVLFYIAVSQAQTTNFNDEWYLNYSDAGTTSAPGHVHYDEAAPEDGETMYCLGIGRP